MSVDLADLWTNAVAWAEQFPCSLDDVHNRRHAIAASVLAAIKLQIPLNEAMRVRACLSEQLDAWCAYHIGLQHVFRFPETDNAIATV